MSLPVYLDYNATTPIDRRVRECMIPYLFGVFGNPSSTSHCYGRDAATAVGEARRHVAALINADSSEIVFTSCATEAVNLALKGVASRQRPAGKTVMTSAVEHPAVLAVCEQLEASGFVSERLPVSSAGQIDMRRFARRAATVRPLIVALMLANSETGTVFPVCEAAKIAHSAGAVMLSDATQAVGKIPVDVRQLGVDLLAFSAHKLYGPKGVGALFVRGGSNPIELEPLLVGGGQEGGLRSGTHNVAGIVGFGEACRIAREEMAAEALRVGPLRDSLEQRVVQSLANVSVNGSAEQRLPNTTNLCFHDIDAEMLLSSMPGVAASTKSACCSGPCELSHVLLAMGRSADEARSSVRLSLGRFTTQADIDTAIGQIATAVRALRGG